jgi:hypothetical protein
MTMYLDGIQEISDNIESFDLVGSGTVTVAVGGQFLPTGVINRPTKLYRNYVLLINNKSTQTINGTEIWGVTTANNYPVPNLGVGFSVRLKLLSPSPSLANNTTGATDITSEEPNPFCSGNLKIQFNLLNPTTAAGTIDWALIGY